jgi:hypothetical protein
MARKGKSTEEIIAFLREAECGSRKGRRRARSAAGRREGLKVPSKQPKRGRLNDGSCIRLRPERPNHVWSYDFTQDQNEDGRCFCAGDDTAMRSGPTSRSAIVRQRPKRSCRNCPLCPPLRLRRLRRWPTAAGL